MHPREGHWEDMSDCLMLSAFNGSVLSGKFLGFRIVGGVNVRQVLGKFSWTSSIVAFRRFWTR